MFGNPDVFGGPPLPPSPPGPFGTGPDQGFPSPPSLSQFGIFGSGAPVAAAPPAAGPFPHPLDVVVGPPNVQPPQPSQSLSPLNLATLVQHLMGGGHMGMIPFHVGAPGPPPAGVAPPPAGWDAHNPAQYYREHGQDAYGAQLWESRHPYAVSHGQIPGWVTQAIMHAIQGAAPPQPAPAPAPPPPSMQYQ